MAAGTINNKYKSSMGMISARTTNKEGKRQKNRSTILDKVVREFSSKEETTNKAPNAVKDHAMLSGRKSSRERER